MSIVTNCQPSCGELLVVHRRLQTRTRLILCINDLVHCWTKQPKEGNKGLFGVIAEGGLWQGRQDHRSDGSWSQCSGER